MKLSIFGAVFHWFRGVQRTTEPGPHVGQSAPVRTGVLEVAKRMECGQLAAALEHSGVAESGSKLTALQTLRDSVACGISFALLRSRGFKDGIQNEQRLV